MRLLPAMVAWAAQVYKQSSFVFTKEHLLTDLSEDEWMEAANVLIPQTHEMVTKYRQ